MWQHSRLKVMKNTLRALSHCKMKEDVWYIFFLPQMYIAVISGHALALCGYHFITCIRVQWRGYHPSFFLCVVFSNENRECHNAVYTHLWFVNTMWCGVCSENCYSSLLLFCLCTECSDFSPPATMMLMIFLCMEGLLFLTFTAIMFCTQLHSICNDETVRTYVLHCVCYGEVLVFCV